MKNEEYIRFRNSITFLSAFAYRSISVIQQRGYDSPLLTALHCGASGTFYGLLAVAASRIMPGDTAWLVSLLCAFSAYLKINEYTLVVKLTL